MKNKKSKRHFLVGVTGASGMLFLQSFAQECAKKDDLVIHGICSESGRKVMEMEAGMAIGDLSGISRWFDIGDFAAPPASGSSCYEGMVVLPCSMGTLAAIAGGLSINLIHRSSDVILKERKKLVLAVRETPLNRTHMENMLKAHDAGAVICPAMPGFYFKPKTLEEAALFYVWRVMDQLGIEPAERKRWGQHE